MPTLPRGRSTSRRHVRWTHSGTSVTDFFLETTRRPTESRRGRRGHSHTTPRSHEEAGEADAVHAVAAERGRPGAGAGAAACRLRQVQQQKQAAAAAGRRGQADAVTAARGVGRRGRFLTPAALCLDVGGRCGRTDTCKNASASRLAPVCFAACPVKHDKSPRSTAPDTEQSFQKVRDVSLVFNITMVDFFLLTPSATRFL